MSCMYDPKLYIFRKQIQLEALNQERKESNEPSLENQISGQMKLSEEINRLKKLCVTTESVQQIFN